MKEELRKKLVTEFEKLRNTAGDAMAHVEIMDVKNLIDQDYLGRCFNEIALSLSVVYPLIVDVRGPNASKNQN